jgi:hypothetical protein
MFVTEVSTMTPTKHCSKRGREGGGEREYNGGVNLFKGCCSHVWNYHSEPSVVLTYSNPKDNQTLNKELIFKERSQWGAGLI